MILRALKKTAMGSVLFLVWTHVTLVGSLDDLAAADKRSLWKVRSKSNTVYIIGSIHLLKAQSYPLDPALDEAFAAAKKLVLEIDLESVGKEQAQKLMLMKGLYTDGRTLKDSIAPETYGLTENELKALGLDAKLFNQFKPWFVAQIVAQLRLQRLGFDPKHGIDQYFYQKAKNEGKEVVGLETFEYQMGLFDAMDERTQERMLLQTLKNVHLIEESIDRIVKAWAAGDMATLDSILLRTLKEYPDVYQRLMVERNRAWLPKIESYLAQKDNYLVVVGVGHLAGKEGVIDMLKAKGYSVEQQ